MQVSDDKITEVVFQLGALKAPGPDGFSGIFYHSYRDIVGDDIKKVVLHFFSSNQLALSLNFTEIVLVPKVLSLESHSQCRPISLCNFCYKIISKILVNRLRPFLTSLISPQQSAFFTWSSYT